MTCFATPRVFQQAPRRLLVSTLLATLLAAPLVARKDLAQEKEDLINVFLSPGLAQWLVGPVARIARSEEIQAYLRLSDDAAAEAFIQRFWRERRDSENPWQGQQIKDIFYRRAEVADRLFTEGASLGRRTDRGAIYVVFGKPSKSGFVQDETRGGGTVEVWLYAPKSPRGLDGSRPDESYFFTKKNGLTVFTGVPKVLKSARRR